MLVYDVACGHDVLPAHFGGVQSSKPYLLKIDFNVPSASSVANAAFIFSINSRFPFRTANAALGLGEADWYVSTTRAPRGRSPVLAAYRVSTPGVMVALI